MKLLFDENLSPTLVQALDPEYPGSQHVRSVGLRGATDDTIRDYARQHGHVIVSKDNDFRQLSFLHGAPPKIIWLSVGNAGTETILSFLRNQRVAIHAFEADAEASLLVLQIAETPV